MTRSSALGDVDGDGDLDLVCGNYRQSTTLYRNLGTTFETAPAWLSGPGDSTTSVALGDVDGDGDLDLVCGNIGSVKLYRNLGTTFETAPAWSSGRQVRTRSVALGDVDGDGDLDLVCGNVEHSATLYRNLGTTFETTPAWSSGLQHWTFDVALGDVDGDGDLDLVCGNDQQSARLYRNLGTTFENLPVWSSGPQDATSSVALGDVDGDGDLDLICGNYQQSPTLYRNLGATFETTPAWSSGRQDPTTSVTLGDVDGDGDLDLICGNYQQRTTLYRNLGTTFETAPFWSSGPLDPTYSVALGDVDVDGDLDLVCGNLGESTTLYRNLGTTFEAAPAWSSGQQDPTLTVALGDVDGDGDLDLVCGNDNRSTTLYRNLGSTFGTAPAWSSGRQDFTRSVALGDVDGDGDLDLVCGNDEQSTTLYRNQGTSFEFAPAWSSEQKDRTGSVALGDVDGDGDLDLVCGNYIQSTTLYRNLGTTFETAPAWFSGQQDFTQSVALGDVDGDGDLDLVCGNYESTTLYRNLGTTFETAPAWSSGRQDVTTSVALGDVDGDGDLDLVCGNDGQSTTLYRNQGTSFEFAPAWSSGQEDRTASVALGDVDGDGDLDLVCGNFGQSATLYRNLGTTFETAPAWSSGQGGNTWSVALGDVDGDGDLDLVCGDPNQSTTLYHATVRPPFRGDPLRPTNQLPNNSAYLRRVRVVGSGRNLYRVRLTAVDVESDPVRIVAEYAFRGVATWSPILVAGGGNRVGPLFASAAGVEHAFDWDVGLLPFDSRPVVLRLRAISYPHRTGLTQDVAAYLADVGPLDVRRAEVELATSIASLAPVTVGDTVFVLNTVRNRGNDTLSVASIDLPSPALATSPPVPFDVPAQDSLLLKISFAPTTPGFVSGAAVIHSNDPFPAKTIQISATALALEVQARPVTSGPAPLAEALTVVVLPAPGVRVERGKLLYRPAIAAAAFDTVGLAPFLAGSFGGVIPGAAVTDLGVELYVDVENSGVFAREPCRSLSGCHNPTAAPDTFLSVAVQRPGLRASLQTSSSAFLAGREIKVQVGLPPGATFSQGMLHYRGGGEGVSDYHGEPLVPTDRLLEFAATIPGSAVRLRGLEYWIEVRTLGGDLATFPERNPRDEPAPIRVSVSGLTEDSTHAGEHYRMVSIPLDFESGFVSLGAALQNDIDFGSPDKKRWRLFRYMPAPADSNTEWSSSRDSLFGLAPGRAFWLVSRPDHRVDLSSSVAGLSTPTGGGFPIVLSQGWNQFGDPFAFPVSVSNLVFPAEVESLTAYDWTRGKYAMRPVKLLEPFEGYFVFNNSSQRETLRVRPVEATTSEVLAATEAARRAPAALDPSHPPTPNSWRLRLRARTPDAEDDACVLGLDPRAADQHDGIDARKPPNPPGPWVRLGFPHPEWKARPGFYRRDLRAPGSQGHVWEIDMSNDAPGEPVVLDASAESPLPPELAVVLVDRDQGVSIDLRRPEGALASYRLVSYRQGRPYRLALLAGTADFVARENNLLVDVPVRFSLDQNSPNPFNAATRIRFGLPEAERVTISIYNVRGERIADLRRGEVLPAGYQVEVWGGTDAAGRPVGSGVYFCRLQAGGTLLTRRLVLLR